MPPVIMAINLNKTCSKMYLTTIQSETKTDKMQKLTFDIMVKTIFMCERPQIRNTDEKIFCKY